MIKIFNHISFARDWLDRAEEKIRKGSFIDGEVYLSLAESEIRKAWEYSYSLRKEKRTLSFKKKHLSLVVGIVLILVFAAAGTNYLYTPVDQTEHLKLSLTDGYRARDLYSEDQEIRLINVDFMIKNNYDRGR